MMPVYLVMVKDTYRWVDSIWVQEGAARERAEVVKASSTACGGSSVHAWVVTSRLEDGELGVRKGKGAVGPKQPSPPRLPAET